MKNLFFLLLLFSANVIAAQQSYTPDEHGKKLKQFYLSLNVESLWIAGQHINWETGEPDNPDAEHNIKTHCSSFVAASCKRLNIYILRPPEHGQGLLADAQFDWLAASAGAKSGWRHINGDRRYMMAQDYANKGYVVVAVVKNPDEHKPGHIAFVTPADISATELTETGPKLIMAGTKNYNRVSLKTGFKWHLTTWPESQIEFYYYRTPAF